MHILHTVLYTFPELLKSRICSKSRASLVGDHSFILTMKHGGVLYSKEKLDANHSQGLKGRT